MIIRIFLYVTAVRKLNSLRSPTHAFPRFWLLRPTLRLKVGETMLGITWAPWTLRNDKNDEVIMSCTAMATTKIQGESERCQSNIVHFTTILIRLVIQQTDDKKIKTCRIQPWSWQVKNPFLPSLLPIGHLQHMVVWCSNAKICSQQHKESKSSRGAS